MKLQILPNWCKRLGLAIFFIGTIIGGGDDFRAGFNAGYNDSRNSYKNSEVNKNLNEHNSVNEESNGLQYKSPKGSTFFADLVGADWLHLFEIAGIFGMLIYMLSKEKVEDDYIDKLRSYSFLFSSIIWLVIAIIIYSFNEGFELSIDYFIYLFIWTYLITFFIKKRIY